MAILILRRDSLRDFHDFLSQSKVLTFTCEIFNFLSHCLTSLAVNTSAAE
jgi:hypothetical protein